MAKFRDSKSMASVEDRPADDSELSSPGATEVHDRAIGSIIRDLRNLSAEQVEAALAYQREHQVRFGEALVALGYASTDDVIYALSQQFHYPYVPEAKRFESPALVTLNQPFSPQAEAFRAVRSQLMMRLYGEAAAPCALAVASAGTGEGRTYFAANAAIALAQLGGRTLLVDGDMRKPQIHELFGLRNTAGLSSILSGRSEAQVIQQVDGVPSLYVLPVGPIPPNPLELLERPAFGLLMKELANKFDHVVVDTPAAASGADAAVIAVKCGAALVLVRRDATKVDALQDLLLSLHGTSANVIGTIVNEF